MSYSTIVLMANDNDLQQRFIAAASQEKIPNAEGWAIGNRWAVASYDQGAIDAYQFAVDSDNLHIGGYGKDPAIVTDGMILSIVQALWAEQQVPPPEAPSEVGVDGVVHAQVTGPPPPVG